MGLKKFLGAFSPFNKEKYRNDDENASYDGEILVETENKSLVASTLGKFSKAVTAVMTGDFLNFLTPLTKDRRENMAAEVKERYKDVNFKDDLKVYVGKSGLGSEMIKQMKDEGYEPSWLEKLEAWFTDFRINSGSVDHYDPTTNTISVFDAKKSTLHHEMGHAVAMNAKEGRYFNENLSKKSFLFKRMREEFVASKIANVFMTPEERKKHAARLASFYGTYEGGVFASFVATPAAIAGWLTAGPIGAVVAGGVVSVGAPIIKAYWNRITTFLKSNKGANNMFFKPSKNNEVDRNPFWKNFLTGKKEIDDFKTELE